MELNTLHLTILSEANDDECSEYELSADYTASEVLAIAELVDLGMLEPIGDTYWVLTDAGGQALVDVGWA